MEPQAGVVILVVVVVALVLFMSTRDRRNKLRIAKEVKQAGGEPVEISFQFVGYDRDNQHYNVRFTDALGRKHDTRCKVNIWQNGLYWERTPTEIMSDLDEALRANQFSADPSSSKEQLINDLTAENNRLRKQLLLADLPESDFYKS